MSDYTSMPLLIMIVFYLLVCLFFSSLWKVTNET